MQSESDNRVLVRLTGISQELTVGVGAAIASVRTLTDFSLVVRARELVVLSGSSGAGERAVLAVIAGDRRGVSGTCEVHENVRMRALRISASSAFALAQEWQRAEYETGSGSFREYRDREAGDNHVHSEVSPPRSDVFLLDVVNDSVDAERGGSASATARTSAGSSSTAKSRWRSARHSGARRPNPLSWNEKNREALYNWAVVCQRRGGAIAMAVGEEFGLDLLQSGLAPKDARSFCTQALARAELLAPGQRSPGAATFTTPVSAVRETPVLAPSLRVVAMHCGRLAASIPIPFRSRSVAS